MSISDLRPLFLIYFPHYRLNNNLMKIQDTLTTAKACETNAWITHKPKLIASCTKFKYKHATNCKNYGAR